MSQDPPITCWFCAMQFPLEEAELCNHTMPTPVCPFCLNCFCTAPEAQKQTVRQVMDKAAHQSEKPRKDLFNKPIGAILLESGLISAEDLRRALDIQQKTGLPLGQVLVEQNLVSADIMRITLLNQTWIEPIDLDDMALDIRLIERFGVEFCSRHQILPVELLVVKDHAILRLAISRRETLEAIRIHPAFQTFGILPYLAPAAQIAELLGQVTPFNT